MVMRCPLEVASVPLANDTSSPYTVRLLPTVTVEPLAISTVTLPRALVVGVAEPITTASNPAPMLFRSAAVRFNAVGDAVPKPPPKTILRPPV